MSLAVVVTPEADRQFAELVDWWDANRPASTTSLEDELHRVLVMLAAQPALGRLYERRGKQPVRHFPLRGTPYHVFYATDPRARELRVLAVWSMMRKMGPQLPTP